MKELPHLSGSGLPGEEAGRIARLNRVMGYVAAIGEIMGDKEFIHSVYSINDHKGVLTVTWDAEPSSWQMACFVKAWSNYSIGDGCDNVCHVGPDGPMYTK